MDKIVVDENLIQRAKQLDDEALEEIFAAFKPVIRRMAVKYFFIGSDRDDVIQEAMIALFKALQSYDSEKGGDFVKFSMLCIAQRLKSAVKNSLRKKHIPLNQSVSIDDKPELTETAMYLDPEEEYINNESFLLTNKKLRSILSAYELYVVSLLSMGMKPTEIAEVLGKKPKSVDNALQRIRKKAEKLFENP